MKRNNDMLACGFADLKNGQVYTQKSHMIVDLR